MEQGLEGLVSQLKSRSLISLGEEAAKQGVILPILSRLGWDTQNIEEVVPEHPVGDGHVDYCLRASGQDRAFIECKKPAEDLDDQAHQEQFLRYAFEGGIDLAVLTNGISWWFYLPREKANWQQRKFFAVDLTQQDEHDISSNLVALLSKSNVISGSAERTAHSLYRKGQEENAIRSYLPKAWNRLVKDADEGLIELVASATEKLSGVKPSNERVGLFISDNTAGLTLPTHDEDSKSIRISHAPPSNSRYQPTGYTGRRVSSFVLDGRTYEVESWKDMLVKVCEIEARRDPQKFEKVSLLKGRKRTYFSPSSTSLTSAIRVKGSKFYVETNLSANAVVRLCNDVLSVTGHSGGFKINSDSASG